jgi:hypothetical protein
MIKSILGALLFSATTVFAATPVASALPGQCWNTPFGGFCDGAAQIDGSFNHCENIGFGSSGFQNCYQACHDPVTNRAVPTDMDMDTPC